jgi:predicted DNA-binding transcriptional regulator YafY
VEPFANSLGVYTGPAERVELEFDATAAEHVIDREWHRSQAFQRREDGSATMTLDVSIDHPLKAWILSFGGAVRVLAPAHLADEIVREIDAARERHTRRPSFDMLKMTSPDPAAKRVS